MRFTWRLEQLFSTTAALLLWFAATTTAGAAPLQEGEYYRPLPPEASGRVSTTAAYRRSPCPAINALANHGFISRDGRAITAQALKAATIQYFHLDNHYADTLVALAKKPVFDLNELSAHNVVEHDMSLVHRDAFFGEDPAAIDAALVDDFVGHVGASGVLDPWFFARTQQRRLRACMTHNPQCEFSNEFLLSVTLGRQGLLMRVMGGRDDEAVDLTTARMLLVEEKISPNWTRSSTPISQFDIQNARVRLFDLLKASGEWLGDGGSTASEPLMSDANVTQCLQATNNTLVLSQCDGSIDTQKFLLDSQQQLRVTSGGCLKMASVSNTSVIESPCLVNSTTTQQWRYDASGRLRPVQAPDLCLDLVTTQAAVSVTAAACSTRTEQRFFSFSPQFQPSISRLASLETPGFCLGLAVSGSPSEMATTPCDTTDETQELTLDERKRLVFAYDTTQCIDLGENDRVVQKPCSSNTTTWQYDSLSRLHPGSSLTKCIQLPGNNASQLVLADCADGLAQKWFIYDTKNADVRPATQYYRPNVFESSGKPGTSATYSRSPCPALNTLANHGLLPRSGRNLTASQVQQAVVDYFNIDPAYAHALVQLANRRTVFDLDELSIHNAAEHDMSLVHADAFYGQDPAVIDPTLAAELFRHVGLSATMDVLFFARTQARRLKDCQARNPQCGFSNEFLMSVALGRLGLLMRGMGGENQDRVELAQAQAFLIDERFPANFTKSPTPVTQKHVQDTRIRINALLQTSGEWLVDGFLNGQSGVSIVSEGGGGGGHALCLAIANGSVDMNASLVVTECDDLKRDQKWRMDTTQRVVNEASGLCLAALDFGTQSGTAVVQLECVDDASNQVWTYDASGRLRPDHAATLCLDAGATIVTLRACAAFPHQRFYSMYDGFRPNGSHLTSIEFPERCVSGARGLVEVTACDPLLVEQQLTMDAASRIVFTHSATCLSTSAESSDIVQATCTSDASQRWQYDSLGRLHPASTRRQCLTLDSPGTSSGSALVILTNCSDDPVQRWYASDAHDPNNRPLNAYYRPNRDESSGRLGTTATYSRSPCPALNALANHGILSRDGRNISRIDLVGAAVATFNIEPALAESFLTLTDITDDDTYLNLDQLSDVATFQYTGSLVHSDAFFNPDPAAIDPDLVSDLFARVGSGNAVDLVYLAAAQRRRLDAQTHTMGGGTTQAETTLSPFKYQKPGLLLRVLSGKNEETVSAEVVKQLLVEERLPGMFLKPAIAVTLSDTLDSSTKVQAMIETGGASISGEGGTSSAWLSRPFQPKREWVYAYRGNDVLCLRLANGVATVATCNATDPSQLFTYDSQQRLVVELTASCLDVVDGKVGDGAVVGHVDCTDWRHQQWIYDASGRLHPQHASKFCLSVGASGNEIAARGVISKCSDSREQQFFAASTKRMPDAKQLVSVAPTPEGPSLLTHCLSVSSRTTYVGLSVDQCNDSSPLQQFLLDDAERLSVQGSSQCVATTTEGRGVVLADCAQPQAWMYDSLGRLHLRTTMGLCLTAGASSNISVSVESCSTAATQRWLVASLKTRTPTTPSGGGPQTESAGNTMNRSNAGRVAVAVTAMSLLLR